MKKPKNESAELPILTRAAPIESVDAASRTMQVVWSTGAAVARFDWLTGSRYTEELVMTDKSIRLDLLNAGAPVLDNHRAFERVADAFAIVKRAWIEKGRGLAEISFCDEGIDERADMLFRKVTGSNPVITALSCGYKRHKIEIDKSKDPQLWRVVDWQPFEISFVLLPADPGARVRSEDVAAFRNETVIGRPPVRNAHAEAIRLRARRRSALAR